MPSRQAQIFTPKTDWCYGCVDRTGTRKFRQLTANGVCEECDQQGRRTKIQNIPQETVTTKSTPRSQQPARLRRKAEARKKQELLKAERLKKKIEIQEKQEQLRAQKLKEENQLIQTFNQLQAEAIGREWRQFAAQRLGWSFLKLRRVIWRVKKYNNLEPTAVKEQVLKLVTEEYQTLKQISRNFQKFSMQWIYEILERLANERCIEKRLIQKTVG